MKGSNILISILVPTYNRVKYLKECLDSVIDQKGFDLSELELIVSDNSEGDETKNFMEKYMEDNRNWNIQYSKNKTNLGMVGNWNKLLELKKGEYFIFLSDDDKFYDENSLKILYDSLLKYKLDVCYGKYRVIDGVGNDKGDFEPHKKIGNYEIYYDSFEEQMQEHSISFGGILYKKFGYKYDYQSRWFTDWHMNLQYLYNNKKVALINIYTFYYRVHNSNDSNSIPKNFRLKFLFHRCHYFGSYRFLFGEIVKLVKLKRGNLLDIKD